MVNSNWTRLFRPVSAISGFSCLVGAGVFVALYPATLIEGGLLFIASYAVSLSVFGATILQIHRHFTLSQLLQTLWRPVLAVSVILGVVLERLTDSWIFWTLAGAGVLQLGIILWLLRTQPRGSAAISFSGLVSDSSIFFLLYLAAMVSLGWNLSGNWARTALLPNLVRFLT